MIEEAGKIEHRFNEIQLMRERLIQDEFLL